MCHLAWLFVFVNAASSAPAFGDLPLSFEPNRGQLPRDVRYYATAPRYSISIQDRGATFQFAGGAVSLNLLGSRKPRAMAGLDRLPGVAHFLSRKPVRNVPQFGKVEVRGVYDGIDLQYYGNGQIVEYDFVVAPGAEPKEVRFRLQGAVLASDGALHVKLRSGELLQHAPVAYQWIGGRKAPVEAGYLALADGSFGFRLGSYDRTRTLVIDPTIVYSVNTGDGFFSEVMSMDVDSSGSAYLALFSTPKQVVKLNPQGTAIAYRAEFPAVEVIEAIKVDANGSAYICGRAGLGATTRNAIQAAPGGGSDFYIAKLTPNGSDFVWATFLGGSDTDTCTSLVLAADGTVTVGGSTRSANFPLRNAVQNSLTSEYNTAVARISAAGTELLYSTYWGAMSISGMAVDGLGNVYLSGGAASPGNFPLVNPLFSTYSSVLLKLSPAGQVITSTTLPYGGWGVAADATGNAYILGYNPSPPQSVPGVPAGMVIGRLNAGLTRYDAFAALGTGDIRRIAVDGPGYVYAAGIAQSTPIVRPLMPLSGEMAFAWKFAPDGTTVYATPLGASYASAVATDGTGAMYVAGRGATSPQVNQVIPEQNRLYYVTKLIDSPDQTTTVVRVATSPDRNGLEFVVDGVRYANGVDLRWLVGSTHTLTAFEQQGSNGLFYRFRNWSNGGPISQTVTATQDLTNVTANFDIFTKIQVDVLPLGGGTVTFDPPGANGLFPLGSDVRITAVPAAGKYLQRWSNGSTDPFVVIRATTTGPPINLTANFTDIPPVVGGLRYVPVTPCRLVDTRPTEGKTGAFGPPVLQLGTTRVIPVPQGTCNIPTTARAYSVNATVVPRGPLAYLSLYPTGQQQPLVSTLNSFEGLIIANAAIVPAGTNGSITAYVTDTTDLILDINGYFTSGDGLVFYPLSPCRVSDTRTGAGGPVGAFGPPSLGAGASRTIPVRNSTCAVPTSAAAYVFNVTVVPKSPLDYITAYPSGGPRPFVSVQNSPRGRVLANMAIVPAGSSGSIDLFAPQETDAVLDITGYFAPEGSGTGTGLRFYPVDPCRVLDTRITGGVQPRDVDLGYDVAGRCSVPAAARAYSLNTTVVPTGYLGFLTIFGDPPRPFASTLNAWEGQIAANAAIVPAATNGRVRVYLSNPSHIVLDVNGYFAP